MTTAPQVRTSTNQQHQQPQPQFIAEQYVVSIRHTLWP